MAIFSRTVVPESDEKVPFDQIDFEEIGDEAGKAIREAIPRWNVPSAELEKLSNGEYANPDLANDNAPEVFVSMMEIWKRAWLYVIPKQEHETTADDFRTVLGKLRRRQAIYEYTSNYYLLMEFVAKNPHHELSQQVYPHARCPDDRWSAVRDCSYLLSGGVRRSLTGKFIVALLEKARQLLVAEPSEPEAVAAVEAESEATDEADTVDAAETVRADGPDYSPFGSRAEALSSLLQCLKLIIHDHHYRGIEMDYSYDYNSGEEYDAPGNVEYASHWSQLYQYLRKDIEQNGPVPEQLQFFYGHVELGARLERLTKGEARVLFSLQDDRLSAIVPVIKQARFFYGVNYEAW